ncbi:dynamin family protein [Halobacteroides halobius DSM 5150]|uniref:Dynamin family protein n=1 Tax=Halobacteroides halobius (strain ATCC 35273 / DSM 5150 / MD-1) TaxID=748449 RepID=L0K7P7_HALHC|nr:dynamin family protein [Halobacteroides halobius]AGB41046.1 dynamin family protein [Halobacteroides halobius DSM 5150]
MNKQKWEEEKKKYISILENSNEVIEYVLKISNKEAIINQETLDEIRGYYEKNKFYLEKLEKDIFELAIVGLEKAGKSTFSNALISNDVLPSKSTRCTFTSTQLEYGDDEAIVEFYDREEFNQLFREMLHNIKYENADQINFDTLELKEVELYFDNLRETDPNLYKAVASKTEEDIKEIIKGKDQIARYLDKRPRTFKNKELNSEELRGFITDKTKSRAVKKVKIKSSKLNSMKNIIIYDVPGFDSPTQVHEEQTLEKLKNADGIILITDVGGTPNLRGTQLNLLNRESDYDGIKLNEKLFIFGNKIDNVNDEKEAKENIAALRSDAVDKHKILKEDRFFVGSAYAYLEKQGILSSIGAEKDLVRLGLSDNIEKLKESLEDYYRTERFEILKKRVNRNIEEIKQIFNIVIKNNKKNFDIENINYLNRKLLLNFITESEKKIKDLLSDLRDRLRSDILSERYFSEKLQDLIDKSFVQITEDQIEEVRKKESDTSTEEFPATAVNSSVRKELYKDFMEKFTTIIVDLADEKAEEINDEIVELFMQDIFDMSQEHIYYEEVKEEVENLIQKLTFDVSYDKRSFIQLIERFSGDLFDILIKYPFGTVDRFNKFKEAKEDFYSLAMYHSDKNSNKPYYMQPLVNTILAHKKSGTTLNKIEKRLFDALDQVSATSGLFSDKTDERFINNVANELEDAGMDLDIILKDIREDLDEINQDEFSDHRKEIAKTIIKRKLNNYLNEENFISEGTYLKEITKQLTPAQTKDEVLQEINTDISHLKELLKEAVINAISLEKPFVSTVTKKIYRLIDKSDGEEFSDFYSKYTNKILYDEFSENERKEAIYKNRKKIIKKIKEATRKLEV